MSHNEPLIDMIGAYVDSGKVELPVFSSTALRIQKEVSKEDPDSQLIERLIVSDQALTSAMLKVANSAYYMGRSEVATIRQAVVRLGINEVSNIVTMVTHGQSFKSADRTVQSIMQQLWQHSIAVGIGTSWLAKHLGMQSVLQEAFIAGLLHDVGKLLILKVLDEMVKSNELEEISPDVLGEAMDILHTGFGATLMQIWNLPEIYAEIAHTHHDPECDPENHLLAIVRVANQACHNMGCALDNDDPVSLVDLPETEMLNLSEIDLAQLETKLEDAKVIGI